MNNLTGTGVVPVGVVHCVGLFHRTALGGHTVMLVIILRAVEGEVLLIFMSLGAAVRS